MESDDLYTIQNRNPKLQPNRPTQFLQQALPSLPYLKIQLVGEIELANLAVTLDYDHLWYRDHLIPFRVKSEQIFFGLTGPTLEWFKLPKVLICILPPLYLLPIPMNVILNEK